MYRLGLVEGLLGRKWPVACFLMWLIMCPFWFGGMLAGEKRVGCLALLQKT